MLNFMGKKPFQDQMGLSNSQFYRWQKQADKAGFKVFRKVSERTPVIDIEEANKFIDWQCDQYRKQHLDIHLREGVNL